MPKTLAGKVVKVAPTWAGLLPFYFAVLESGNAEGRGIAREELRRMAQAADFWNEECDARKRRAERRRKARSARRCLVCHGQGFNPIGGERCEECGGSGND